MADAAVNPFAKYVAPAAAPPPAATNPFSKYVASPKDADALGIVPYHGSFTGALAQGGSFGLSDEIEAGLASPVMYSLDKLTGKAPADAKLGDYYDANLKNIRRGNEEYAKEHPIAHVAAETLGGLMDFNPKAAVGAISEGLGATIKQGAATGATVGAATGFGDSSGGVSNRLKGAAISGAAGATIGAAAPAAIPLLADAGKGIVGMVKKAIAPWNSNLDDFISETAGKVLNETSGPHGATFQEAPLPGMTPTLGQSTNNPGLIWLERSVEQDSPKGADFSTAARTANNQAITKAIGDVGDLSSDPDAAMRGALVRNSPAESAQDQVLALAKENLGGNGFYDTSDALNAARKLHSDPLYEKALAGGSIAPLQQQFEDAFAEASSREAAARKAVGDADMAVTLAAARSSRAGNDVYANSDANEVAKQADAHLEQAQRELENAQAEKQSVLDKVRQAQDDAASNKPGAVWSPRIQQFLDDPILKRGLAQGRDIQSLEALAKGKKFDPTEYGITGADEDGNPIISKVPNMRLLDTGKKGLDAIVESYRNPVTGILKLDQYGNAVNQVRAAYVKELDRLNPDYAVARAAWSGPSQSLDALSAGRNMFHPDSELTAKKIASLAPGDLIYHNVGVMRAIEDVAKNSPNGAAALNNLLSKPNVREKLTAAFGSPEGFDRFQQRAAEILNPQPDIAKALARDNAGAFTLPQSGVASQFIRTGKGAPEAFDAYLQKVGDDPQALQAARDAFAQKFLDKVQTTIPDQAESRMVSASQVTKFLGDYDHIVNSKLFNDDQRDLIQRIATAADMSQRTARAGAPGGSDTYAKLAGKSFLDVLIGPGASKLIPAVGAVAGSHVGGAMGAGAGYVVGTYGASKLENALYGATRDKVLNLVHEAMADPALAKTLMTAASSKSALQVPATQRRLIYSVLGYQAVQPPLQPHATFQDAK